MRFPQAKGRRGAFERLIMDPFLEYCWEFLKLEESTPIENCEIIAVLACAGPVKNNRATVTSLGIKIDGKAIEQSLHCQKTYVTSVKRALIINEVVAQGYGCLTLDHKTEVRELIPASHAFIDPNGPKVCVGAGTGLGECFLTPYGSGYTCFPSEGGHVEYNPRSDLEVKLRAYLMSKFDDAHRISTERVVSGTGLANVYEFLALEYPDWKEEMIHDALLSGGDLNGKVVADSVNSKKICALAMDIMISAYGSEVGSAALKWIPTGGLYVTGALTRKNIEHIEGKDSMFMKAYWDKGRASHVLKDIPLFAVMVEDLGVRGAYHVCTTEYAKIKAGT
ncbi:Glucokinase [Fragilaria crotonensis]|nr:Glucokinase [Fragilaria crotonensis]